MLDADALAHHHLAVFRDRLILEARPPITDDELRRVEETIGATVPEGLVELWRVTFGGALDYDLAVQLSNGQRLNTSLRELFYPGSRHYHDLYGWIANEDLDAAGRLVALPFGGFEYLERVYVGVTPRFAGAVLLYAQGIPWAMRVNEDTVTVIAQSVGDLFDQLSLDEDPFLDGDEYDRGREMAAAIERLRAPEPLLARELTDLVRASVFDWRTRVAAPYRASPQADRAARLALDDALSRDDAAAVRGLAERRWPLDLTLHASSTALPRAIASGSYAVAAELLALGASSRTDPIVLASDAPTALVERCIAARCPFAPTAVLTLGSSGNVEAARLVVARAVRHGQWDDLPRRIAQAIQDAERSAEHLRSGKTTSNVTPESYDAQAAHLRALAAALDGGSPDGGHRGDEGP